jgi:hypothetical protein
MDEAKIPPFITFLSASRCEGLVDTSPVLVVYIIFSYRYIIFNQCQPYKCQPVLSHPVFSLKPGMPGTASLP